VGVLLLSAAPVESKGKVPRKRLVRHLKKCVKMLRRSNNKMNTTIQKIRQIRKDMLARMKQIKKQIGKRPLFAPRFKVVPPKRPTSMPLARSVIVKGFKLPTSRPAKAKPESR